MRAIHAVPALCARGLSARDGSLACSAASRLSPEKRLSLLGVERSFAVQAGREVRILVRPEEIDDLTATRLARDIVKKIETTPTSGSGNRPVTPVRMNSITISE